MREAGLLIQGREIYSSDIARIRDLLSQHPDWSQWKISRVLCHEWEWKNDKGQIKDIACRSLLRKLESRGAITLPPRKRKPVQRMKDRAGSGGQLQLSFLSDISQAQTLKETLPLSMAIASPGSSEGRLFASLLAERHYLGYKGSVGEHLAYLVRDTRGGLLACVLFGAAAWKTASRDAYIGWDDKQRQKNLKLITNNMRFLLLTRVPHLASYVLGTIARRISRDWQDKYGHPIVLLETFVEKQRFTGTCYRAANWLLVGQTRGRSRNDRNRRLSVPIKDVYCYPLSRHFKKALISTYINTTLPTRVKVSANLLIGSDRK
ncbi:MAG: Druantia anti-phage system protein DruA [bacterium]|nr:DUF4338 domain-containing protein [Candidatus Margulisiibacteriota bacterium]